MIYCITDCYLYPKAAGNLLFRVPLQLCYAVCYQHDMKMVTIIAMKFSNWTGTGCMIIIMIMMKMFY